MSPSRPARVTVTAETSGVIVTHHAVSLAGAFNSELNWPRMGTIKVCVADDMMLRKVNRKMVSPGCVSFDKLCSVNVLLLSACCAKSL